MAANLSLATRRRGLATAAQPRRKAGVALELLQLRAQLQRLDRRIGQLDASCELPEPASLDLQDLRIHARALRTRLLTAVITLTADE